MSSRVVAREGCDARAHLVHQVGDECVQDTAEGFIDANLGACSRVPVEREIVKAAKEREAGADLIEREDAGVETVVEVGSEVGDLVGEVDQLRFKGRS